MKPAPGVKNQSARILIVDDERQNRQLLEVMLGEEGFVLVTASSGEEALAMVAREPPDLILLDVMMPGMDGYEVARRFKGNSNTEKIPVIMVSALDDRNSRMSGLNAGAEDFISKPVDRAELCVRVRNLLRLKANDDYHSRYRQELEEEVGSRIADLADGELLYRSTFDAAPVGIVHVSLNGRWLRVNQRVCDLLGYSAEELQNSDVRTLTRSEEGPDEHESFRQMAAGTIERHVTDEKRYRRKDGSYMWARVNMSLYRDAEGKSQHYISVIEDVTERRTLEAQIRQANKMDAIGQLASGVAHDFNNLLTVILGHVGVLERRKIAEAEKSVGEIRHAAERAANLTRQLLVFARRQAMQMSHIDLSTTIAETTRMLDRILGEDIQLDFRPAGEPLVVQGDAGMLDQVLMNLAVNARDAMPRGGRLVIETAAVEFDRETAKYSSMVRTGSFAMLSVSDTGCGIPADVLPKIFDPFFTTKDVGKGTGLGLATVFGIVQQHGGWINAYSEAGHGSTFRVYFPAVKDEMPQQSLSAALSAPEQGGSETILLVEDEAAIREMLGEYLQSLGYEVLAAGTGLEAVEVFEDRKNDISLLLTDIVMPGGMTGVELSGVLIAKKPELAVVFMSGYSDMLAEGELLLRGGINFLAKPFALPKVAEIVRLQLERRTP